MHQAIKAWREHFGETCPLCRIAPAELQSHGGKIHATCERCGEVQLTEEAFSDVVDGPAPPTEKACAASSFLRENPGTLLTLSRWEELKEVRPPSVGERAEKLLKAMAARGPALGEVVELPFEGDGEYELQALGWCADEHELLYLLDSYLGSAKKWLEGLPNEYLEGTTTRFRITPAGHEYLDSLRHANVESAQGFCAMWFGDEVNPTWLEAIRPAIADAGYLPMRIDEHAHANRIDDEIMAQIRRSKFVVSDFTGQRGGVYFEAGFALGLGLPVIWTVRDDQLQGVHFDNRQYNFIIWSAGDLPAFRRALAARIVALLGQGPIRNQ